MTEKEIKKIKKTKEYKKYRQMGLSKQQAIQWVWLGDEGRRE